jgi:hypothetical protein
MIKEFVMIATVITLLFVVFIPIVAGIFYIISIYPIIGIIFLSIFLSYGIYLLIVGDFNNV